MAERSAPDEKQDIQKTQDQTFIKNIKPVLRALEKFRVRKYASYKFRMKVAAAVSVVMLPACGFIDYWLLMMQRGSDDTFAGLTFAYAGAMWWWVRAPVRQYISSYKDKVLPKVARTLGNLTYNREGKIAAPDMKPSDILPRYDRYTSEDHFSGRYKGVDLQFSEIELEVKRRGRRRSYHVTVFKGLAILLTTNSKKFYGHTILSRNRNSLIEWAKEKTSDLERADLVDPEFEKMFDVFTNDQVEARYLIDPVMIEKIKKLYKEYSGDEISAAFYNNGQVLFLIANDKNHFEPANIKHRATNLTTIKRLKNEIGHILSIIDRLELYDPSKAHDSEKTNKGSHDQVPEQGNGKDTAQEDGNNAAGKTGSSASDMGQATPDSVAPADRADVVPEKIAKISDTSYRF